MMKATEEYQNEQFLNAQQQAHNNTETLSMKDQQSSSSQQQQESSSGSSSSSAKKAMNKQQNIKKNTNNRQIPHYWPADKVPYTGVSYCEFIQYCFAFLFISVLVWIFVGLKHFGDQSTSNLSSNIQQSASSSNSNDASNNQGVKYQKGSFQQLMLKQNAQTDDVGTQSSIRASQQQIQQKMGLINRQFKQDLMEQNRMFGNSKQKLTKYKKDRPEIDLKVLGLKQLNHNQQQNIQIDNNNNDE